MIDWDDGDAEIVLDLWLQITEYEKPLEFLYF